MKSKFSLFSSLVLLLLCAAVSRAQSITVEALDGSKASYTVEQLRQMPRRSVSMNNPHTNAVEKYEGVLLRDLLAKSNTPSGDEIRDYVEVTGKDGYSAVFALTELDPAFQNNNVVLAISEDGKPLDDKVGPVRLVAPQDKRPARSLRMVTTIAVRRAP